MHQMVNSLLTSGESGAGEILARIERQSENIRNLAYRLYTVCERKGWSQDASKYDQLIRAWDGIETAARLTGYSGTQISLFGDQSEEKEKSVSQKKKTRKKKA